MKLGLNWNKQYFVISKENTEKFWKVAYEMRASVWNK